MSKIAKDANNMTECLFLPGHYVRSAESTRQIMAARDGVTTLAGFHAWKRSRAAAKSN